MTLTNRMDNAVGFQPHNVPLALHRLQRDGAFEHVLADLVRACPKEWDLPSHCSFEILDGVFTELVFYRSGDNQGYSCYFFRDQATYTIQAVPPLEKPGVFAFSRFLLLSHGCVLWTQ